VGTGSETNTKLASEGYRLLEESKMVTANAQAIGDSRLQEIGDELGRTARKMTERFTSERQVERSLQKLSNDLAEMAMEETGKASQLTEAGEYLEEAYSKGKGLEQALKRAAEATSDEGLSERLENTAEMPGGPSESDVLEAMQRMQEEAAGAQSRQNAVNQATESLNQSMSSLGYERQNIEQNRDSSDSGEKSDDKVESGNRGREDDTSAQSSEDGGGGSGTQGGHIESESSPSDRLQGSGDMQRLTGQLGKGEATSTEVITSGGTVQKSSSSEPAAEGSFGGPARAKEEAVKDQRIPASYRKIVSSYFDRGK
jgi:hypothetical protein